jgi:hypothetical protein
MKVESIHYERKRSDGSYGNRTVSLSASLDGDEPLLNCIAALRDLANQALDADERIAEEEAARKEAVRMERYRAERAERQAQWERERVERATGSHEHDMTAAEPDDEEEDDLDDDEEDEGEEDDDQGPRVPF